MTQPSPNLDRLAQIVEEAAPLRGAQRAAFLRRACGMDDALRGEVDSLLAARADQGEFLAEPTRGAPAGAEPTMTAILGEGPGTRIGPYKLLQLIGEGGFGSVFMAEQEKPVARKVALKIIKLGMDTRQVIARFEAERQALALMEHPNIARVLDAGATESGRPYFVMELCRGERIVEYCDKNNLSISERLELFAQVCQAVQHAHTKGIIHRDIKPSNILVSTQDGRPHAKVIDFGIAKATASKLTEKTLFTEHKALVGTPEYMSPEQAEGSLDIDTRTDVYSLGVLLYELLTGTTPFSGKELRSAAYAEIQRIIREVEPPRPSTRLSVSTQTIASIAAKRHTEPGRLGTIVRGELDWIVMKALEKDRQRRYETANGLAMDIRRYLTGEPVVAAPPSTTYRFKKFVRRNRLQVTAAGAVALVLAAGAAGTSIGLVWALREKDKATLAAQSEAKARTRAETISGFVTTALKAGDAENSGLQDGMEGAGPDMTILAAMDNAIRDINSGRFKDDPETEAALRDTIGRILFNNAKFNKAKPLLEEALATRERVLRGDDTNVADSLCALALLYQSNGQYSQAEPLYHRALAIYEKGLGPEHPWVATTLDHLVSLLVNQYRFAEAEPLGERALDIHEKSLGPDHQSVADSLAVLADLYSAKGEYARAEPLCQRALAIREKALGPDHPWVASSLSALARIYESRCLYDQAEPLCKRALAIRERALGPDHIGVAKSLTQLAVLYKYGRQYDLAEPLYKRALAIYEKALGPDHAGVATRLNDLAVFYTEAGQHAQAEPLYTRAMAIYEKAFGPEHPDVANTLFNMGWLLQAKGEYTRAEPLFARGLAIQEKALGPEHPTVATFLDKLARNFSRQKQYAEAEPLYARALAIREKVLGPAHPRVADSLGSLAGLYTDEDAYSKAEPLYTRAIAIQEKALGPDNPRFLLAKHDLGTMYWAQGRLDKSIPLFEEVLKQQEAKLGRQHQDTARTVANLGVNYRDAGRIAEAIPLLEEAYRASGQYPRLRWVALELFKTYPKAADPAKPENVAKAVALVRDLLTDARAELPKHSPDLANRLATCGQMLLRLRAWDEAEPLAREALAIRKAHKPDDWRTSNAMSLLGGALLGQNKLVDAEPLLLEGYRGLKDREEALPPQAKLNIREATERLVRLYEIKGNEAEAAAWRRTLEAHPTAGPAP